MPLYSTVCPLPINRKMFRHRGSVSPIPQSGLSLWLKADAGVSTAPETFISQIVVSGAGSTESNGTYTRTSGGISTFYLNGTPGDNNIYFEDGYESSGLNFYLYDYQNNTNTYIITIKKSEIIDSSIAGGDAPLPTFTTTLTATGNYEVTTWADQSGNGRNAVQSAGYANTSTFGGKSFISFPDNTYLTSYNGIWPSTSTIDYGTIIIVARFPSSYQGFSSLLFNHGNLYIGRGNSETYPNGLLASKDNDVNIFGNSNLSNNTNYLIGMTFNLDSLGLYLNGTANGSGANFENGGSDEFTIGFNGEPFSMAEIVVYNRVLTTQERQQVEAYLNTKYAIY